MENSGRNFPENLERYPVTEQNKEKQREEEWEVLGINR